MKEEIETLIKGLGTLEIEPDSLVKKRFQVYLDTLHEYKNKVHLISHADHDRVSLRHFLPSIVALPYIGKVKSACDIGAGAGFPSIPIKIIRPEIGFTLFESTKKKARFLETLIKKLELAGVDVIADRAENYHKKEFELVFARAAGKIVGLLKTIGHLLQPGGRAIFFKSADVETEVKRAGKEMEALNLTMTIKMVHTPVENRPMALVIMERD